MSTPPPLIIGLVWHVVKVSRRKKEWRALGEELGLEVERNGLRLVGPYRGFDVAIGVFSRRSNPMPGEFMEGRGQTKFYTQVATTLHHPLEHEVSVRPEGLGRKLGKAVGVQDVQVGDPEFDAGLWVSAPSVEAASACLPSELRRALLAYREVDRRFELRRGALVSTQKGYPRAAELRDLIEAQHDVALTAARVDSSRRVLTGC